LGHVYEMGGIKDPKSGRLHKLTKKSIQKARELYQEAADLGCELAKNYLGQIAFNYDKSFYRAVGYFKAASSSGKCAKALHNLAICFELGVHEYNEMHKVQSPDNET
jgi:TPR repeat protein